MRKWLVRLGENGKPNNSGLYRDLARDHFIIKIGYGIDEDITTRNRIGIKEHFERRKNVRKTQVPSLTGFTNSFINEITPGDIVISPFADYTTKIRIGIILSECNTVDSFFKDRQDEYCKFLKAHPKSDEFGFIGVKPARKVKWLTKEMDFAILHKDLKQIKNMIPAVNELKNLKDKEIISLIDIKFLIP